jgi:cell wall-associated NlpC family hydrolase
VCPACLREAKGLAIGVDGLRVRGTPSFTGFQQLDPSRSRRLRVLLTVLALLGASSLTASASAKSQVSSGKAPTATTASAKKLTASNWDASAQRSVIHEGLMLSEGSSFNGAAPLTLTVERTALGVLAQQLETVPIGLGSGSSISVTRFDTLLVNQLGLGSLAAHVQQVAGAAGLQPPSYFGTETIARFLGLRYEHPVGEQALDLYPWNPITRAEAAYSFSVALQSASWAAAYAEEAFEGFSLPHLSTAQLEPLRIAVSKIGMPYVWGGTTDGTEDGLEHGGYDCSGFAWRVYKLSGLAAGQKILGRTAAEQAGEIPKSQRIRLTGVQPGDLLFFGSAHFNSTATESNVIHEGIALSSEWAINSSGQGVYVLPLTSGWLNESFTWARRVL